MGIDVFRVDGSVLLHDETADTVKSAVVNHVSAMRNAGEKVDLRGANLQDANLQDADLQDADLQDAYLRGANLRGANLRGADLQDAYLQGAYLRGACLPTGERWEVYLSDVVPALVAAGGRPVAVKAWTCHDWTNCPMAEAFGADCINNIPLLYRPRVEQFIQLFDAGLIPAPTS